jgi:hypothetical protein
MSRWGYILILLTSCACATAPPPGGGAPDRAALDVARGRVDGSAAAAGRAQQEVLRREPRRVLARYNPPHCECPPFEVLLRGRWVRTWLWDAKRPDNAVQPPVVAEAGARGGSPLYVLRARMTGEARAATNENEYGVLEVTSGVLLGNLSVPAALAQLVPAESSRTAPPGAN